jgi:hypothetical protein
MKTTFVSLTVALALSVPVWAAAQGASAPMGKQQSKMADCNKEAGDKKGDERKAFMKSCLSAKKMSQQEKMKSCNKEAGDKKGDDRKAFMKGCLSA